MTDKNTAAATPEAAPAAPSKMDLAKPIYAGLKDGSIPLAEGKSARATFIARVQEEDIGCTKSGAATYWQNLESAAKGGKLYPHTGKKKTTAPESTDAKGEEAKAGDEEGKAADEDGAEAKDPEDLSHLAQ